METQEIIEIGRSLADSATLISGFVTGLGLAVGAWIFVLFVLSFRLKTVTPALGGVVFIFIAVVVTGFVAPHLAPVVATSVCGGIGVAAGSTFAQKLIN